MGCLWHLQVTTLYAFEKTMLGSFRVEIQRIATLAVQLGAESDTVSARDHVRLLGITISEDLSLDHHMSVVSAMSFY